MLDYYIDAFKPDVLHVLTMSEIGMAGLRFERRIKFLSSPLYMNFTMRNN